MNAASRSYLSDTSRSSRRRNESDAPPFAYTITMVPDMRRFFITFAVLTATGGCGGGGGGGAAAPFVATPAPTASPPPAGPLTVSPSTIAFTVQGQTATVTANEPGYSGTIAADGITCATIASVTPGTAQNAPATFTVAAQGAGACTLAFTDRFGQRAQIAVGVTITHETLR